MKYWQKENDSTTAVLKFYGEIYRWWNGANDFTATIEEIEKKHTNLEVRLHCYGGEVFEGNVIYNAIARTKLNVTWYVDGVAASMGGYIPFAKGKVIMAENAFWMIHVPSGYTFGSANDHFNQGKLLKAMEENFAKAYKRKTGKSDVDVKSWLDGGDHWFSASECIAMKIADEISNAVDTTGNVIKPDNGMDVQSVFNRYTALAISSPADGEIPHTQKPTMNKQHLITSLGLTGVTAQSSDTAVEEAIVAKAKADAKTIADATALVTTNNDAVVASLIAAREKELHTTFTKEQKENLTICAKSGVEPLKAALAVMTAMPNLANAISAENKHTQGDNATTPIVAERKAWKMEDWRKNDASGLEALSKSEKTEDKALFKQLYLAEYGSEAAKDLE